MSALVVSQLEPWGFVQPLATGIPFMLLQKSKYMFGRSSECDYQLSSESLDNRDASIYSQRHFELHQVRDEDGSFKVYLFDRSRHGMFIDGEQVPQKKYIQLPALTIISLCEKANHMFAIAILFPNAADSVIPQPISQYHRTGTLLGRGGFGDVYFGYCPTFRSPTAVKVIKRKPDLNARGGVNRKDLREALMLKDVEHRNIIQIYDIIETKSNLYMILEYASGGDLFSYIQRDECNRCESTAKLYFNQVIQALDYLHDQGITHRDIKLENMLLMSSKQVSVVKLADFGLSRIVVEEEMMSTLAGTPMYLAPEVLRHLRDPRKPLQYTMKVDLWSMGVSLYALLVHQFPFHKRSGKDHEFYEQVITGRYSFPPRHWSAISEEARNLVKSLLQEQDNRLDCKQVLAHPWLRDCPLLAKHMMFLPAHRRMVAGTGWVDYTAAR